MSKIAFHIRQNCDIIRHMPILKNAKKALRSSERKRVINRRVKTQVKTFMDKVKKSGSGADSAAAYSAIDKAVKKNLIHKNKAARLKSQVSKAVAKAK